MPFSKVRVVSAPLRRVGLSTPIYSGRGNEILSYPTDGIGTFGASAPPGQFRFVALNIKGQRVGFALDREGQFPTTARQFDSIFKSQ